VEESWENFLSSPLTGINFGTSRDPYFVETATLLSAPTEKGFIITAVLEEIGLIGMAAFLGFLYLMVWRLWRDGNIIGLSVFVGFFILNFGEMTFFSLGGTGLFLWSMVGLAIAIGHVCRDDFLASHPTEASAGGLGAGTRERTKKKAETLKR
jgi:hypothetical protein